MVALHWVVITLILLFNLNNSQCGKVEKEVTARDRRGNGKKTLKIANYNVEWLFSADVGDTNKKCTEWDFFMEKYIANDHMVWQAISKITEEEEVKSEAENHIKKIAANLDKVAADIIILEEICDCDTLEKLKDNMKDKGKDYHSFYLRNPEQKLQLGIITKLDPAPKSSDNLDPDIELLAFDRGSPRGFRAIFEIGTQKVKLVIYGLHLSAGGPSAHGRREGAALELNKRIKKDVENNHYVLVTGDFNTYADSPVFHETKYVPPGDSWIQPYLDTKILDSTATLKDSTDPKGIQVTADGDKLEKNMIISDMKYRRKFKEIPITIPSDRINTADKIDTEITQAWSKENLQRIEIKCGKTFKMQKQNPAYYTDWNSVDHKLGGMKMVRSIDGYVAPSGPMDDTVNKKNRCSPGQAITEITIVTRKPDETIEVEPVPKTVEELTNLVTSKLKDLGESNLLAQTYFIAKETIRKEGTLEIFECNLNQLNKLNTDTEEYSHEKCGTNDKQIIDYIYASEHLEAEMVKNKIKYEHIKDSVEKEKEAICLKGNSDHIPVSVTFKTEKNMLAYYKDAESKAKWKEGDKVAVYSQSQKDWVPAIIQRIHNDMLDHITVSYSNLNKDTITKREPRWSPDLKDLQKSIETAKKIDYNYYYDDEYESNKMSSMFYMDMTIVISILLICCILCMGSFAFGTFCGCMAIKSEYVQKYNFTI